MLYNVESCYSNQKYFYLKFQEQLENLKMSPSDDLRINLVMNLFQIVQQIDLNLRLHNFLR